MSKLLSFGLLLCLVIASPRQTRAEDGVPEAEKAANVRKLLAVSDTDNMGLHVFNLLVGQLKKSHPDVPQDFWSDLSNDPEFKDFKNMYSSTQFISIYAKHFTNDEVLELIKFYESPVGKKLAHEKPLMAQEILAAAQPLNTALAQKIVKRMSEKGYLKAK